MSPVTANHGEEVAQGVRFGDGAVNVAYNNPDILIPEEDLRCAGLCSLKLCRHAKSDCVGSFFKIERFLDAGICK